MEKTPMTVFKTIYAKRKTVSRDDMMDIFTMEINYHIRQHPSLEFDNIGKPVENQDRSKTFPIHFKQRAI